MTLSDMCNRTWHLLREPGPDTGYPAPTTGDFAQSVVIRDLNIELAGFVSATGLALSLTDKVVTLNITPGLDYQLPADLASLTRIEYTPAGMYPYKLEPLSFEEWDSVTGGVLPPDTGQPYYYRVPFGGYIRLQPAPGPGNAGVASGLITLNGSWIAGDQVTLWINNVQIGPYTVTSTDTLNTIASSLVTLINASSVVTGGTISPATASGASISLYAASPGPNGNNITYYGSTTDPQLSVSPNQVTPFTGGSVISDTITIYYQSLGNVLVNLTNVPGIPAQFHMAPVYGVLRHYWLRKQDPVQAKAYGDAYNRKVLEAKALVFDYNKEGQFTIAGDDISDYDFTFPYGGV